MMQQATTPHYSAVICRACRAPIPVPAIVTQMDQIIGAQDAEGDKGAKVFQLRCRSCFSEKLYQSTQIVELEGEPKRRRAPAANRLIARAVSA